MTVEFMEIRGNLKIREVIDIIRSEAKRKETVDLCFILDDERTLLGTISLKEILLSNYEDNIYDVMKIQLLNSKYIKI
jgi:magnesium transporter